MLPLVVLFGIYFPFHLEESRAEKPRIKPGQSGIFAMAGLMLFAGVSHFIMTAGFAEMVPLRAAWQVPMVYASGLFEILLGIGLLYPPTLRASGILLTLYLVAITPANIYAAINSLGLGGHVRGPIYLVFRLPLQALFIAWAVKFCVLAPPVKSSKK